ncbi:MAG: hypothetical protein LC104_17945 [Bacteroidales bacterium]|nr:hypothetical protein [Bacteroidales bacterium]
MRRRNAILTILLLLITTGAVLGSLTALLKSDPEFYTATNGTVDDDTITATAVVTRFGDLKNDIRSKPEWGATFTAEELNAFLREHLCTDGGLESFLPQGLHSPRVAITGDQIQIAARYGEGFWSTVLSVEARVWLVKGEANVVALELLGVRAGWLPLGSQSILDRITEAARDSNIAVSWYRHEGNPVGMCRFYADQTHPTTQIALFRAADGKLTVKGRSLLDQANNSLLNNGKN